MQTEGTAEPLPKSKWILFNAPTVCLRGPPPPGATALGPTPRKQLLQRGGQAPPGAAGWTREAVGCPGDTRGHLREDILLKISGHICRRSVSSLESATGRLWVSRAAGG